jgi:hypothetical protein
MRVLRNVGGVAFESLRRTIDAKFNDLHDSLEEAYYGRRAENGRFVRSTGWRDGASSPWHGVDVRATPAESKVLFDRLHGALWWRYDGALAAENARQGSPYPLEKLDPPDAAGLRKSAIARQHFETLPADVRAAIDSALAEDRKPDNGIERGVNGTAGQDHHS